jgi:hypothetical protein
MSNEKQRAFKLLYEIVGDESCDGACTDADFYKEDGEWKLFLCGFLEPWPMGKTLTEVEANLREYAGPGFGLGPTA